MLKSNVGDDDPVSSIRIGHRKVGELNVREQMEARGQIELSEKERKRREILQRFPKFKVPGLKAGIREAQANIDRFHKVIAKEQETIREYSEHLALCKQRDRELKAAGFDPL